MATAELDVRGVRAYALYTTFHLLPGLVLEHLTLNILHDRMLASVVGILAWGYGLLKLATRFYRGQGRIPLSSEIRGIALKTSWHVAVVLTALRLLWPGFTENVDLLSQVLVAGFLLATTFIGYFPVLLIFLLPFVQGRLFESWSRRNPG
jgi:hypothetical protein